MTIDIAKELLQFCEFKCGKELEKIDEASDKEIDLYDQVISRCLCEVKKCKQEQIRNSWKEPGK